MNSTKMSAMADQVARMEPVGLAELQAIDGGLFFLVVAAAVLAGGCATTLSNSPARDTLRALRR